MSIIKNLFAGMLLFALLGGCASLNPMGKNEVVLPPGTLNATEVTALFSGKTVSSVLNENGRISRTYYNPHGQLLQLRQGKRRLGTWEVKENGRICLQLEGKKKKCRIITREGHAYHKYIVKRDGNHKRIITYSSFRRGNLIGR